MSLTTSLNNYDTTTAIWMAGSVGILGAAYYFFSRPNPFENTSKTKTMKRLVVVHRNKESTEIELQKDAPIPKPKYGQVLVKMVAAPVNPSDYAAWKTQTHNSSMGLEGSGTVVASGGGIVANSMLGKTVGIIAKGPGTYAEYYCGNPLTEVHVLRSAADVPRAASWFVNPVTSLAILDTVKHTHRERAFIHTAAASQLGQMLVKRAAKENMTIVNVVRKQEQVELLQKLGAKYVINQSDSDWQDQLKKLIQSLHITVAFDAVGGELSGTLLSLLPSHSTVYVYGVLSGKPVSGISPLDLIYHGKQIQGFIVMKWIAQGNALVRLWRMRSCLRRVCDGIESGGWAESQFVDCRLESMKQEFDQLQTNGFTGKKLRIRMD